MDPVVIGALTVFVASVAVLVATRHFQMGVGWRIGLVAIQVSALIGAVYRYEQHREATEAVWHPDAPLWKSVPVEVYWDRKEFADYNDAFDLAIKAWNGRVGCKVLEFSAVTPSPILLHSYDGTSCFGRVIGKAVDENPGAPASTWFCGSYVDVQMRTLDEVGLAHRIALHELGHALGLAHDDEGAMARVAVSPAPGDPPEHLLPSNRDVKALAERYCR